MTTERKPTKYQWVASKRPHAYYPNIECPCWVLVEVKEKTLEVDTDKNLGI